MPVSGLTVNWLSVAALIPWGAKIPVPRAIKSARPVKNGRFRCCRAAVIVLGDGWVIRNNLSPPHYYRGQHEHPVKQGRRAPASEEHLMRANLRLATLALCLATLAPDLAAAQNQPPPAQRQSGTFTPGEIVGEGHKFFGTVSRGLAQVVEAAFSRWGQPNGYVLGQEGSGAFIVGLRYGDGKLYTKNAGDRRVFWEGPSVGFDYG